VIGSKLKPDIAETLFINNDLILRQLVQANAEELFELVNENRESLRQWLPWLDHDKSVNDQKKFIDIASRKYFENGVFTGCILYKDEIAGIMGFNSIDWPNNCGTLGYWLGEKHRGKGLALKSCRRLVEHGFKDLKLRRIAIHCAVENHASRKIPETLGFNLEGKLKDANFLYDHYIDLNLYAAVSCDWK